jgi:non-heme chloroperoxidase
MIVGHSTGAVLRLQPSRSQGIIDSWWPQGIMGGFKNLYECVKAFSETNLTEDLKKFDVPTLIIQGEDYQVVPIDVSGRRSVKLIPGAKLIVYPGAPHGITDTHKDRLNADLLAFVKSGLARISRGCLN